MCLKSSCAHSNCSVNAGSLFFWKLCSLLRVRQKSRQETTKESIHPSSTTRRARGTRVLVQVSAPTVGGGGMLAEGLGLPWGLWLREAAASVFLWVWRRVRTWGLQGRKVACSFTLELGSDINTMASVQPAFGPVQPEPCPEPQLSTGCLGPLQP